VIPEVAAVLEDLQEMMQENVGIVRTKDELEKALRYLEWTHARARPSGVLAEQFDPYTGSPISVSPLTWSHATVMTTVVQYLLRHASLTGRQSGIMAALSGRT